MTRQMRWFASATLFLAAVTGSSQAQTVDMKVRIPFNFVAEDNTLPAGEYVVTRLGRGKEMMRLARNDGPELVTLIPTHVQLSVRPDHGTLIFNKYGNRYFLSEVRRAKDNVGLKLHRSSLEAEIAIRDESGQVRVLAPSARR
jgi:hypothetical protein